MDTKPERSGGIRFSLGKSTYDNDLKQHTVADFDEFQEFVLSTRSTAKGQKFITSAMSYGYHDDTSKHEHESYWRLASHALPRRYLPFDLDGFDTPERLDELLALVSRWRGFGYHTSSSTPDAPRARIILEADAEMSRAEGLRICTAIQRVLEKKLGEGAVVFDNTVYRGEQPVYTPVGDVESFEFRGVPVNVQAILSKLPVEPLKKPAPVMSTLFAVERLGVKTEYPPSSAIKVADLCAQLARMRDMKGAVSEPEWRNAMGVIKHCVEGDELAHEWSKGDERYDRDETQAKIDRWETGPTTCAAFEISNNPACASCKFKGKVKSPIQLGYTAEEVEAPPVEILEKTVDVAGVQSHMSYWPRGFRWDEASKQLQRLVTDDDGVPAWVEFSNSLFYPTTRVEFEDGTMGMRYTAKEREGKWREFEIPTKALASVDTFASALASYEVLIYPRKGGHAVAYVSSWVDTYKQAGVEMNLYKHYGWHHNYKAFLLGDRIIGEDGSESPVVRASNLTVGSKIHAPFTNFTESGSAAEWSRIFNLIYNRPNTEHYQFVALALMASPLVKLFDVSGWHGIPVAMTGDGGHGKTAVGRAACSIYGRGDAFIFQANSATINSVDPFVAGLQNLPCVFDELTGRDPRDVSGKLYALSNGGSRMRADQKGNLSAVNHEWDMIGQINGNTNITESMRVLEKTVSDASSVRVFEINITDQNGNKLFAGVNVQELLEELDGHHGVVGRMFLRYAMKHREKLREDFLTLRAKLGYESPTYDPKERFFIDLIATAIIAGRILTELGIIKFNLLKIQDWAIAHIMDMRLMRSETAYTVDEQVAALLSGLGGHILATKHVSKTGAEMPMDSFRIFGAVHARLVLGAGEERLIVSSRAIDEWCAKAGHQPRIFRRALKEAGYVKAGHPDKFTLTQGTNIPSTRERVIEFVYEKVSGIAISNEHLDVQVIA